MIIPIIEKIIERHDEIKRAKALREFPWRYKDRHGRIWFNTDYRTSSTRLRKWC